MKKKTIFVAIIFTVLLLTTSVNIAALKINTDSSKLVDDKENEETICEIKEIKEIKVLETTDDETHWQVGLIKFQTKGKGLQLIIPLKLLHIRVPIITPQYDRIFPFKTDFFVTLFVYNDENASTVIRQKGKETVYINGSHSILMGMFKMQSIHLLRKLLQNGAIDGFQRLQKHGENHDKGPISAVISNILNKTFGGPIIDISDETYERLDYIKGTPPRYSPDKQIFDTPITNNITQKLPMQGYLIRYYGYLFPTQMFWNRMPIRTNILQFEKTMMSYGITPFVRWAKDAKLNSTVEKIQNLIPDIIFDEPVDWKEY